MIFLKRFYAEGFKSFAQPVNLPFNDQMIGIVGPNGSGKSNIVDALKWTIGEQSIKSLRGKEKNNLIFMGSQSMPEAPFALITLVFDNQSRVLHIDQDEVAITRKLVRKTGENFFFINDQPAKLREIQEIFLDTGLSKGSLGIISQGTVSWFAEAKPEERRKMFEEAAGIGRYIKKKEESTNLLEKSLSHLYRVQDVMAEQEKTIKLLTKQAEKAKIYQEKRALLEDVDVTMMVQDILQWRDEMQELEQETGKLTHEATTLQGKIAENQALLDDATAKFNLADAQVDTLQHEKDTLLGKIHHLEQKQLIITNNLEEKLNSGDLQERSESYKNLIIQTEQERNHLHQVDCDDRQAYETAKAEYTTIRQHRETVAQKRAELLQKIGRQEAQLGYLKQQQQTMVNRGVQIILKNQNSLPGICGTVGSLLTVPEQYEVAIQTALGGAIQNVVVEKRENALNTIEFLKRNNAGRATFLPLDAIQPKAMKPESLKILPQLTGFIGIAKDLVQVSTKYQLVVDHLLGNIIVADDVRNGTTISQMTYQAYKVISLDGDVNFPGGAIQGGARRQDGANTFNIDEKIQKLTAEIQALQAEGSTVNVEYAKLNDEESKLNFVIQNKTVALNSNKMRLEQLDQLIQRYKMEFEALTKTSFDDAQLLVDAESIQGELLTQKNHHQKVVEQLNLALETKTLYKDKFEKLQFVLKEMRLTFDNLNAKLGAKTDQLAKMRYEYEFAEDRIVNHYKLTLDTALVQYNKPLPMTMEEAREYVKELRAEIDALGNVNLAAVEELDKKQAEYETVRAECESVQSAVEEMKQAIEKLDQKAREDLTQIVKSVNAIMPLIFKNLFGGGNCEIKFNDPKNVLESGIEVIAHPPGKKVSNLVLLSGGEKTLVALSVLFAILKSSSFPLVVLDEAEAALDQYNVDLFAKMIKEYSDQTQFLIITHRPGTMKMCDVLYGTTMQNHGVTSIFKTDLSKVHLHEVEKQ